MSSAIISRKDWVMNVIGNIERLEELLDRMEKKTKKGNVDGLIFEVPIYEKDKKALYLAIELAYKVNDMLEELDKEKTINIGINDDYANGIQKSIDIIHEKIWEI